MIGVGVVGYGYWGPNLVRNFAEAAETQVVAVSDLRPNRLALAQSRFPGIQTTPDYRELLANPKVDAVAISTPVSTHFLFQHDVDVVWDLAVHACSTCFQGTPWQSPRRE